MQEWRDEAACLNMTELFAETEQGGRIGKPTLARYECAKDVCRSCPSLGECRDWVLSIPWQDTQGYITAAMTTRERRALQRDEVASRDHRVHDVAANPVG